MASRGFRVALALILGAAALLGAGELKNRLLERPSIEATSFSESPRRLSVLVANEGSAPLEVVAVFVNGTAPPMEPSPLRLEPGEAAWVSVEYAWESGDVLYVAVVTGKGKVDGAFFRAPAAATRSSGTSHASSAGTVEVPPAAPLSPRLSALTALAASGKIHPLTRVLLPVFLYEFPRPFCSVFVPSDITARA